MGPSPESNFVGLWLLSSLFLFMLSFLVGFSLLMMVRRLKKDPKPQDSRDAARIAHRKFRSVLQKKSEHFRFILSPINKVAAGFVISILKGRHELFSPSYSLAVVLHFEIDEKEVIAIWGTNGLHQEHAPFSDFSSFLEKIVSELEARIY